MRILIVGAGAIGGYFGGRLLEAGRDVTFLVRPERAAILAETGLTIRSEFGDAVLSSPPTVLAGELSRPFDLVIVSCKSYDLEAALDAFAAAVGPETAVLPLLNGMRHLDVLDQRFGRERVLGGQCFISVRLEDAGRIVHASDIHRLSFGDRDVPRSARIDAIASALAGAKFESEASPTILLEMWEKWVFLASFAGLTCLMRAAVGDIVRAGGAGLALAILEECRSIAAKSGWPPRPAFLEMAKGRLTDPESKVTASMLGDIERGSRTEADHVLGDLLRRGEDAGVERAFLPVAYMALKAYDARRRRIRENQEARA
jgi:2-dehydropantoate 2-reductase